MKQKKRKRATNKPLHSSNQMYQSKFVNSKNKPILLALRIHHKEIMIK